MSFEAFQCLYWLLLHSVSFMSPQELKIKTKESFVPTYEHSSMMSPKECPLITSHGMNIIIKPLNSFSTIIRN